MLPTSRREFLKTAATLSLASALDQRLLPAADSKPGSAKMLGIQVGAVSFVDEGVDQVLDIF